MPTGTGYTTQQSNKGQSKAQQKAIKEAKDQAYAQKRKLESGKKKQQKVNSQLDSLKLDHGTSGAAPSEALRQFDDNSKISSDVKVQAQANLDSALGGSTASAPAAAAAAPAAKATQPGPTAAQQSHNKVEEEMVIEKGSPGDQKAGYKEGVEPEKGKADGKESKGVFAHLKQDLAHTKAAFSEASEIIGGGAKTVDGADSITDSADAYKQLKKTGGDYLSNMGRGHKGLGVAKLGAYMVGTSMLVDMLNPFDDD